MGVASYDNIQFKEIQARLSTVEQIQQWIDFADDVDALNLIMIIYTIL